MRPLLAALLMLVLCSTPLFAAGGFDTPNLSAPMATTRFFDPDNFLTSAGVKYKAADDLTLEPELGLGYRAIERGIAGGMEEETHRVHAQAGWRLSLADTYYFSAAAKLPVLTYGSVGRYTGQQLDAHYDYDFARPFKNPMSWTGEVGVRLSPQTNLSLYYDQNPSAGWFSGGQQREERIGTKLIWRFW